METKGSHTLLSYDGKKRVGFAKIRKSIWLLRAEQNAHLSASVCGKDTEVLWKLWTQQVPFVLREKSFHVFGILPQTFLGQLLEMLPCYECE